MGKEEITKEVIRTSDIINSTIPKDFYTSNKIIIRDSRNNKEVSIEADLDFDVIKIVMKSDDFYLDKIYKLNDMYYFSLHKIPIGYLRILYEIVPAGIFSNVGARNRWVLSAKIFIGKEKILTSYAKFERDLGGVISAISIDLDVKEPQNVIRYNSNPVYLFDNKFYLHRLLENRCSLYMHEYHYKSDNVEGILYDENITDCINNSLAHSTKENYNNYLELKSLVGGDIEVNHCYKGANWVGFTKVDKRRKEGFKFKSFLAKLESVYSHTGDFMYYEIVVSYANFREVESLYPITLNTLIPMVSETYYRQEGSKKIRLGAMLSLLDANNCLDSIYLLSTKVINQDISGNFKYTTWEGVKLGKGWKLSHVEDKEDACKIFIQKKASEFRTVRFIYCVEYIRSSNRIIITPKPKNKATQDELIHIVNDVLMRSKQFRSLFTVINYEYVASLWNKSLTNMVFSSDVNRSASLQDLLNLCRKQDIFFGTDKGSKLVIDRFTGDNTIDMSFIYDESYNLLKTIKDRGVNFVDTNKADS